MYESFRLMACLVLFIKWSAPMAEPKKHLFPQIGSVSSAHSDIDLVYTKTQSPTENCLCRAPCYIV